MKKTILLITAFTLTTAFFTSCNSPEKKVENAQTEVVEANKDLIDANQAYLDDVESYKVTTAERIAANDKSIAEFKVRIDKEKKEAKADYLEKLTKLEQKNTDLKKKMDDYKDDGKENWDKFKAEFNHDMDELGEAFKDLTVNNVKK
ncbi:peptidase M23 [Arcicella rosea]|uniref:Putative nucleic acid-binding Zn-ribbon protein n=1 Tax=Arcicella rosea TaxID=502909 RepID=A0A841EMD8_9BACT|nr:peptidase M23 [Arcicella rosea]MBB6004375.1 putative nucleic acid-binding Zn-ribbon protein [Arcicella rosea]